MGEFDLIDIFNNRVKPDGSVIVPSGDDAAVVSAPAGFELVMTVDVMNQGIHFPEDTSAHALGYKSLAVSLSDIAAMGAKPKWVTATLSLPEIDQTWCEHFADGFFECADQFNVNLIGGDITRGPLSVTTHVVGLVPSGKAILQSTAKPDEDIYVSGLLGSGAAGLAKLGGECVHHLNYPKPRVDLGLALQGIASAMIDLSDGFSQDLQRLCKRSQVGAIVEVDKIPHLKNVSIEMALHGGDDYELCFTAPTQMRTVINTLAKELGLPLTIVGFTQADANIFNIDAKGYQHF